MERIIKIGGMTCGGCVSSVTKALQQVPGVTNVVVLLETGEAQVAGENLNSDALQEAVEGAGFDYLGTA
jgi:copper chaperone